MSAHWYEEQGYPVVHADAFGGRIYFVEFDHAEPDDEMGEDMPEDDGMEEDAAELAKAKKASTAHLIVHANGSEVWTTSGIEWAMKIIGRRNSFTKDVPANLFE